MLSLDEEAIFSLLNPGTKHLSLTPSFYALSAYTFSDNSSTHWTRMAQEVSFLILSALKLVFNLF